MGGTDIDTAATDHLLTTTRTVRKRLDLSRPVPPVVIIECLRVASQAPTGGNLQRTRWMIVTDEAKRRALGDLYKRAMDPYRGPLNTFHAGQPSDTLDSAIWDYMGEGVADDLLGWLVRVADPETASFIRSVQEDEVEHEANAAAGLRDLLETHPGGHRQANLAAARMVRHMLSSGGLRLSPFVAFLRLGRPGDLLGALVGGQVRRLRAIGLRPLGLPLRV